ncbi:MAG: 23S rRNA methyltransferase [Coxiellaceae bacterium]|nr:23S rRNA methyltransferase [Coxiellaceae bacterium]
MKKSNSKRWLKEYFSDIYVKRAKREGLRARSVYKLMEINKRCRIIKPNTVIVDLGASPGGWSKYVAQIVGQNGKVFAVDMLYMHQIKGVEFIRGDFAKSEISQCLYDCLRDQKVDVVLSDMAPNLSGVKVTDQMLAIDLADKALDFSHKVLKKRGTFLIKLFHGMGFKEFLYRLRENFSDVKEIKPGASRSRSSEVFLLARGFCEV